MELSIFLSIFIPTISLIAALLYIIYQHLDTKTKVNTEDIKKMASKDDFEIYKKEHTREHDKQDRVIEKMDEKIDRILHLILEGKK